MTEEELDNLRGYVADRMFWTSSNRYRDYGDLLEEENGTGVDPTTNADTTNAVPQTQPNGEGPSGPGAVHVKVRFDILTGRDCSADR